MSTRLKEQRVRANLTQAELAKRAGVSKTTIVGIERGTIRDPRPTTLKQLADALGRPVRTLQGPSDEHRVRIHQELPEADSAPAPADVSGETSPSPDDQPGTGSTNWSKLDEVPWFGYRAQVENVERASQQERAAAFDVLSRGRLSLDELEALVFAALVNHFRRAAVTHEYRPELYRARVAVLRRVLDDAECVGRNLWFAFDYCGGLALDMNPDEPDAADLKHLSDALRRWASQGRARRSALRLVGSYPWWQSDGDNQLSYATVESYIRASTSNDTAHWNARQHWN